MNGTEVSPDTTDWIEARYFDFWDVPRVLAFCYRGKAILMDSPFEEEQDEYRSDYYVWELAVSPPEAVNELLLPKIEQAKARRLADVAVSALRFYHVRTRRDDRFFARFQFGNAHLTAFELELFGPTHNSTNPRLSQT